ncbi:MAG: thymidine phosphorylase [Cyanobacteria bacterium]|nr:thymidine phosphorylase [Cyanobacteriota bacterium]
MASLLGLIEKKRDGLTHTASEIDALVHGFMSDELKDYQMAAWLMAVCTRGLTLDETAWLTEAYVKSGRSLDLSNVEGVVVDKHSTGGVGDKTTLVLVPLMAAAGLKVAKLSGRGLGFTGGTIDKLESIPGFRVSLSNTEFVSQLQSIGQALSSQTSDLAPADGKIYALRDVSGTIPSIALIAASVVSKKIAAGAQVIVLDIKVGEGAFMKTQEQARELASVCRAVGERLGRSISTVISSMDQPLGLAIGNSLEVQEAIDTLHGKGPEDLEALCLKLGAVALYGAGQVGDLATGEQLLFDCLKDGRALEQFKALLKAQGGEEALSILEEPLLLPQPSRVMLVPSLSSGYINAVHSLGIAQAAKMMGAGRTHKDSPIDLSVGVLLKKKIGDWVDEGEALAELYIGSKPLKEEPTNPSEALQVIQESFDIQPNRGLIPPLFDSIELGTVYKAKIKS